MKRKETASVSDNMNGPKSHHQRARQAMPILVRQATAKNSIFYEQLADEIGMSNPRNLNYPLGSVGRTMIDLGREWGEPVPPIQCLVINQTDKTPGHGFGWFMPDDVDWKSLTKLERRNLTEGVLQQIYAYPKWPKVLAALNLEPATYDYTSLLANASRMGGVGEGNDHKEMKEYVRNHPEIVDVAKRSGPGRVEERLPSGDAVDVFFEASDEWVAVEVKPASSGVTDLTRGLYQCVKYRAVIAAVAVAQKKHVDTRAVLVIGGTLPIELIVLKTMLGVHVIENVVPT